MHVVAVRTGHLALWNRMMRRPIHLIADVFVAAVAGFTLIFASTQNLIAVGMYLMAGIAGNICCLVLATHPKSAFRVAVMAGLANLAAVSW